jgi:glucose 1-dehydrogenase
VIAIEPGIYTAALQGGMRLEDSDVVRENGLENLFDFPMELYKMKLAGRVAVITGGARGIGAATAVELARHGANIAFCDILQRADAEQTIRQIEELGRKTVFFQAGVGDRAAMERMFAETAERLGGIDILVNNAARSIRKPLLDLDAAEVEQVWSVVLWGTFHCSQLAARRMVAQGRGGNIVMISSVHASRAFPNSTAYNGAKAAVNHMALTWAAELAPHRVRVNVVEPGWIDTPGERAFFTEEQIREQGAKLPLGRLGTPQEIASVVRFLVSEDSSYITGSILRADGGIALAR